MRASAFAGCRSIKRAVRAAVLGAAVCGLAFPAGAEVILQYFNTSWRELTLKLPELAEVGYGALWLPPPTKGSSQWSVGYDCWDPFDIGGKDQRGTVRTRYGTEADLLALIETAHRFGIRVYFDNIMNHRAFDVPGYNEYTPIDTYPGMLPEDFHLRVTEEGFYRKWDNVANWGDTWQVQFRNFSDLIDIAQESPDNGNFGTSEGDHVPKLRFVRHPAEPWLYDFHPTQGHVGFYSTNITSEVIASNEEFYREDVNAYLIRAVRWLVDRTKVDGLRLDAVKHVPAYFFGEQWAGDKDFSTAGYCGQAQWQFNQTRGYIDDHQRDSVFDPGRRWGRDDLMMFGEHLGEPPAFGDYIAAGMRLVDSRLHGFLNGNLGKPWGYLGNLQYAGGEGFSAATGVPYVKSHDDGFAERPELHFALILTREGLPCVYTDGNYQSETLGESGGAFPRHANTAFLGQFGDARIPNLVYIHEHFARGGQIGKWGDGDVVAYERHDSREGAAYGGAGSVVLFFVMNDDYSNGQYREIETSFNVGDYLWQYSAAGGNFYYTVPGDRKIKVITPPGGYFAFSYRTPEASDLWSASGGHPVTIYQDGAPAGWMSYARSDGPDGDPAFNPYGTTDADATDFTYTWYVPRVTSGTNLRFVARVDGSAANVLMKLDGGINLNAIAHGSGDLRDHPPGNEGSWAVFEGYEQADFVQRQYREKFAAADTATRNVIGSAGAETYVCTIGSAGFTINPGATGRDSDADTADWIYHEPGVTNELDNAHFWPPPENGAGGTNYLWVKVGYANQINRLFVYYTTNGVSWPEGAGGEGRDDTRVAELFFATNGTPDGGTPDWWTGTLPPLASGTELRYKIGGYKQQGAGSWEIVWPGNAAAVARKKSMLGVWEVTNINASTVEIYPHNDFAQDTKRTGLREGFHVLRARAFLNRENGDASLYNTFVQPFYFDAATPSGEIRWPQQDGDTISGNAYGVVVRTDPTVVDVWVHVEDDDPANDDAATGHENGNGLGTNLLAQTSNAWVRASEVTASLEIDSPYPREWRFSYANIPADTNATIRVRLLEQSSSTNMGLGAVEGHWTELTRTVLVDGDNSRLFFDWPAEDGAAVKGGWDIRVRFTAALGDGLSDEDLRNRFLVKLDGVAQGQDQYRVTRNIGNGLGELLFALPDLYNDVDPERLVLIEVTHTRTGGVKLEAARYVRFLEGDRAFYVDIIYPPEYDSDGKPFEIVLPESPSPDPEDRQVTIRVETDLGADTVWIQFTNSVGTAVALPTTSNRLSGTVSVWLGSNRVEGVETPLTGTVSIGASNTLVTGTGTLFSNELAVSNVIRVETNLLVVTQIVSQTQCVVNTPWPGAPVTNVAGALHPAFDSELNIGSTLAIGGNRLCVEQILSSSNLVLSTDYPDASASGLPAWRVEGNGRVVGNLMHWDFAWTNMTAGRFQFLALVDTNATPATAEAWQLRNVRVVLREMVDPDPEDADDDDDGLMDTDESRPKDLPDTNNETWNNGDVHTWQVYGRTDPNLPDSDGDSLPDGLESGWRQADTNATDTTTDTDGDGFPNFRADLDPPFYNTVPDNNGLPNYVFYESRTKRIHGSLTDPNNPDSDYDGLPDGVEDANRNGWADGDGLPLGPTQNWWDARVDEGDWPDGEWDADWAKYAGRETDPNKADTDEDGAGDGYGEDTNFNGRVDGDLNSNRVWEAGSELWLETDPLNPDTDYDGLPDGWERRYDFDPLNDGIPGHTNMMTGLLIDSEEHGANGNPDGDFLVTGGVTNPYVNIQEFENGTNPRVPNTGEPPPEGSITIGPGPEIGTINGVTYYEEFMDWAWEDCLVLDEYEGGGNNNQGGDVYKGWDGWDESRDIVAFYMRDGGDADGNVYFRLDFYDLRALAEEGNLDCYVVIDIGSPGQGEAALPDDVDTLTEMGWEAVVAVYQSGQGRVYVDRDRDLNSATVNANLLDYGVEVRDQSSAGGFGDAYFNAGLDAVEFSISRQALLDAGWNGLSTDTFNLQVYTTKDGTGNVPPGPGDIGGRSDIRDAIYNDGIAEDYWQAQEGLESVLAYWIPGSTRAGRAKVAAVVHGNQAIQPGSTIQSLINTGEGAGYHRVLLPAELFKAPLNLHVTPTLAAALAWAAADPAGGRPWLDGPALNADIARLAATNLVWLLGSSFSDHMLPYFTTAFNIDNEELSRGFLQRVYGRGLDRAHAVYWIPERLADLDVCRKIRDMEYGYTLFDQDTHLFNWFGRNEALIDGAYRLNEIRESGQPVVRAFVINNLASSYRFANTDGGLPLALRALLNRKARSGTQDQVVTLLSNWEDFTSNEQADAWDLNLRWLANRPWTAVVALEDIARGGVDLDGDGSGDAWGSVWRDVTALGKQAHNWLNHATQSDYDHWYVGQSGVEEGLENKRFDIRPGVPLTNRYGMVYGDGIVREAWDRVQGVSETNLALLARAALHASVFQTAFHDETEADLRRYSTGEYMYPATASNSLALFARVAQSQTRQAAVYAAVDDWAAAAGSVSNVQTMVTDADLDGEGEYALFNDRVYALFEAIGGRLVGVWVRDLLGGGIYQALGNVIGYAGSETEEEGAWNVEEDGSVRAYRTSGLKDWYVDGSVEYVNRLYTAEDRTNGWRFTSDNGAVQKLVTLAPGARRLEVVYTVGGVLAGKVLYVRNGFSPDLGDLLTAGQTYLAGPLQTGGVVRVVNTNYAVTVRAGVGYADAGHSAGWQAAASDEDPGVADFGTVPMRNQAQTHQVEVYGSNTFAFALEFSADPSDWDGDLMPNLYEDARAFLDAADGSDGTNDWDADGFVNRDEYVAGTDPDGSGDLLRFSAAESATNGFVVRFPAVPNRLYSVWWDDDLNGGGTWSNATPEALRVPAPQVVEWVDDGSTTDPDPSEAGSRFYRVRVALP